MSVAAAPMDASVRYTGMQKVDESLASEAQGRLAPILRRMDEKGLNTVMFLALVELQKSYPWLQGHELEVLLKHVMRQSGYL